MIAVGQQLVRAFAFFEKRVQGFPMPGYPKAPRTKRYAERMPWHGDHRGIVKLVGIRQWAIGRDISKGSPRHIAYEMPSTTAWEPARNDF
jgi:hypothetical protein